MPMLPCRVLCLLAIVFCCVSVTHANAHGKSPYVELARKKVEETLKLKEECERITTATTDAAHKAQAFAEEIKANLETIAADPKEVEKRKIEGRKFIENTTQAAAEAKEVADKTTESATETKNKVFALPDEEEKMKAEDAAEEAENAARVVKEAEDRANTYVKLVEDALQKLDDEVAAAKEKKEKPVETQAQEQTRETQEKQEKQKQHYRSTVTINIHGENLDALLNGAANNSGMALNDGSSSPALLRVPLLLLLLSVLGCMAVC
ncbi:uncharacterized protein TM35_000311510 [Trypanosoma theileri]|uniref:Surface protein TolT n=1 Tax=Trypanosoma theileri TaxID=67003 RepID=A0A1X0NML2_9TRYP|nr:uncharacterized protein TM35_000311510 [Trypanosoma theileri]ORC85965.1 hypothetical protein TM35_000311510 [Trypanosoma theileri]